jgi:hypothetical protein
MNASYIGSIALCLLVACGSSTKRKPAPGAGGEGGSGGQAAGGTGATGGADPTGGAGGTPEGGSGGTGGSGATGGSGGTGGSGTTVPDGGADASVDAGPIPTALVFEVPDGGAVTLDEDDCARFPDGSPASIMTTATVEEALTHVTITGTWYLSMTGVRFGNYEARFMRMDGADSSMLMTNLVGESPDYSSVPGSYTAGQDFSLTFFFNPLTGEIGVYIPNMGMSGTPVTGSLGTFDGSGGLSLIAQGARICGGVIW